MHRSHETLKAWRLAHQLALEVSRAVKQFGPDDRYVIGTQLRRAVLSIPTNLVEGKASYGTRNYLRYASIANASAAETDYLLQLSRDLGCLPEAECERLRQIAWRTRGMIFRLVKALRGSRELRL